jgi:hypothetical protein
MNSDNSSPRLHLSPRTRNVVARYDSNFKIAGLASGSVAALDEPPDIPWFRSMPAHMSAGIFCHV